MSPTSGNEYVVFSRLWFMVTLKFPQIWMSPSFLVVQTNGGPNHYFVRFILFFFSMRSSSTLTLSSIVYDTRCALQKPVCAFTFNHNLSLNSITVPFFPSNYVSPVYLPTILGWQACFIPPCPPEKSLFQSNFKQVSFVLIMAVAPVLLLLKGMLPVDYATEL